MANSRQKPTALKVAAGNPGNRPLPVREPMPAKRLDRPPKELTQDEVGYWRYAIDNAPSTLLKNLDREVLKIWSRAAALHQSAREQVDAEGLMIFGAHGMKAHPLLAVINQQAMTMLKAGTELGFSPVARTRISVDEPRDENPYETMGAKRSA